MNKTVLKLMLAAAAALTLAGCLTAPVMPPPGIIYNKYTAPLHYGPSASSTKSGEASTGNVLGLVAWGDASMAAAAEAGGLKTINGADYRYYNILGVYQKYTTVVHGE